MPTPAARATKPSHDGVSIAAIVKACGMAMTAAPPRTGINLGPSWIG